jgi:hypothetical protein
LLSTAVLEQIEYETEKGYSQEWQKTSEACIQDPFYTFGSTRHCIKDSTNLERTSILRF